MKVKKLKNSTDWGMPSRTGIGVTISVIYVGMLISLAIWRHEDLAGLKLNELGDFAAGAFGPMAILWLVLGYFQQGDELKQNTDALKQQATELKQSAEHQAALVEVSRLQVAAEVERHREERRRQKLKIQPKFFLAWEPDAYGEGNRGTLQITNFGAECMEVQIACDEENTEAGMILGVFEEHPILRRNEALKAALSSPDFAKTDSVEISVWYDDSDDETQVQTYVGKIYTKEGKTRFVFESYAEMADRTNFHEELFLETDGTPE